MICIDSNLLTKWLYGLPFIETNNGDCDHELRLGNWDGEFLKKFDSQLSLCWRVSNFKREIYKVI